MTAGLSLGAFLTFGLAGAALAPAAQAADGSDLAGEMQPGLGLPLPPDVGALQGFEGQHPVASTFEAGHVAAGTIELPPVARVDAAPIAITAEPPAAYASLGGSDAAAGLASASDSVPPAASEIDLQVNRDPNELLQFDDMQVPRWIVETILRAAEVTGVDPVYMMALADKESSFLPDSKARTSSAEGLFQFLSATWLELVHKFGDKHGLESEAQAIALVDGQYTVADEKMREHILDLRRDPYLSALMAAEMKKRDREVIERRLGRSLSRSEFYLAHFFGVNSASKFMSLLDDKPKQSAPRVFPAAARANKSLFYAKKGRKTRQLTVSEVFDKIDAMIDKRLERYEDVATIATADASL
jgi:hypothetical protein